MSFSFAVCFYICLQSFHVVVSNSLSSGSPHLWLRMFCSSRVKDDGWGAFCQSAQVTSCPPHLRRRRCPPWSPQHSPRCLQQWHLLPQEASGLSHLLYGPPQLQLWVSFISSPKSNKTLVGKKASEDFCSGFLPAACPQAPAAAHQKVPPQPTSQSHCMELCPGAREEAPTSLVGITLGTPKPVTCSRSFVGTRRCLQSASINLRPPPWLTPLTTSKVTGRH